MDFDMEYLRQLLAETNRLRKTTAYRNLAPDQCRISYIPTKNKFGVGMLRGLRMQYDCAKYKLTEKDSLRKGSKTYAKIFRKDGKILQVESYQNGRLDVIFQSLEADGRQYFFPFSDTGGFYPTYTYVTTPSGDPAEEYYAEGNQIVYERYSPMDTNHVRYSSINYVPTGIHPILAQERGLFTLLPELSYSAEAMHTWLDG